MDATKEDKEAQTLLPQVYFPGVFCQNEDVAGSGAAVLSKEDEEQLSTTPSLRSPQDDVELLLYVPFMETVTIQSILVGRQKNSPTSASPKTLKLFVDRDDIDFELAKEIPAQATIELPVPSTSIASTTATVETAAVPIGRFRDISSVTLFFEANHSVANEPRGTEVTYIGFHGFCTHGKRLPVTYAVHESQSRLERHEVHGPGIEAQEGMGFH